MSVLPDLEINLEPDDLPTIPLPNGWSELTLQAVLHVITLARIVIINAANWPSDKECDGLRLRVENDRLRAEVNLLKHELAIKDARFTRLEPRKRPDFLPTARMEILALKAFRGWNNEQVARCFQLSERSIRRWLHGVAEGDDKQGRF